MPPPIEFFGTSCHQFGNPLYNLRLFILSRKKELFTYLDTGLAFPIFEIPV